MGAGYATVEERYCAMEKVSVLMCECCGQFKGSIKKNAKMKNIKTRGRWNFLSDMDTGDTLELVNFDDFENARRAMHYRGIKYRSAKMNDGSGYQLQVK